MTDSLDRPSVSFDVRSTAFEEGVDPLLSQSKRSYASNRRWPFLRWGRSRGKQRQLVEKSFHCKFCAKFHAGPYFAASPTGRTQVAALFGQLQPQVRTSRSSGGYCAAGACPPALLARLRAQRRPLWSASQRCCFKRRALRALSHRQVMRTCTVSADPAHSFSRLGAHWAPSC